MLRSQPTAAAARRIHAELAAAPFPTSASGLDLLEPTPEEEKLVEAPLAVDVPTREEMKEIETSNRLYEENGARLHDGDGRSKLDTDRAGKQRGHVHPRQRPA